MVRAKQILAAILLCFLSALAYTPTVAAAPQSSSSSYSVDEVNFGSGGELNACSATYCSKQSAGELTVGNTSSASYSAQAGFNTNREEDLEVSITGAPMALGNVDVTATKYGSTSFSVRTFPAYGYSVVIAGNAPKSKAGYTLASMSSADISRPGTEQFGINLKANTSPSVGAEAALVPDGTFAFGAAATGYDTVNNFKFTTGDTIAQSLKGYGQTNFTLSAITNISTSTPAGDYAAVLDVIAVPTF
jgi:hypothetical protein